jgi:hypothetical protein
MSKQMIPGMGASSGRKAQGNMPGAPLLKPGSAPKGRPGGKKGVPNFKARITKPGGMASGGAVDAGQGSGVGRLARSK